MTVLDLMKFNPLAVNGHSTVTWIVGVGWGEVGMGGWGVVVVMIHCRLLSHGGGIVEDGCSGDLEETEEEEGAGHALRTTTTSRIR